MGKIIRSEYIKFTQFQHSSHHQQHLDGAFLLSSFNFPIPNGPSALKALRIGLSAAALLVHRTAQGNIKLNPFGIIHRIPLQQNSPILRTSKRQLLESADMPWTVGPTDLCDRDEIKGQQQHQSQCNTHNKLFQCTCTLPHQKV